MKTHCCAQRTRLIQPISFPQEMALTLTMLDAPEQGANSIIGRSSRFGKTVLCANGFLHNFVDLSDVPRFVDFDWGCQNRGTAALAVAIARYLLLSEVIGEDKLAMQTFQELLYLPSSASWYLSKYLVREDNRQS